MRQDVLGGCGSGVEPAPYYQKVAGSIPPGLHVSEHQTAPDVQVGTLHASVWICVLITVSCFGQKHLINALKRQSKNINAKGCT